MIVLSIVPDRIIVTDAQIVRIYFNITDTRFSIDLNKSSYFGSYININIRKVGSTDVITLYPLRFNGTQLVWDYTPSDVGTFIVNAIVQNEPQNIISSSTFIVDPRNIVSNVNTSNNINLFLPNNNIQMAPKYKSPDEEFIEFNKKKISL